MIFLQALLKSFYVFTISSVGSNNIFSNGKTYVMGYKSNINGTNAQAIFYDTSWFGCRYSEANYSCITTLSSAQTLAKDGTDGNGLFDWFEYYAPGFCNVPNNSINNYIHAVQGKCEDIDLLADGDAISDFKSHMAQPVHFLDNYRAKHLTNRIRAYFHYDYRTFLDDIFHVYLYLVP